MTRQLAKPQPSHERFSDAFVILSVTILSLASGAWLISNLGLELSSALLAALAIYCVLLLLHLLMRRAFAERDSSEDFLDEDPHWDSAAGERFAEALAETSTGALPQERPLELPRSHLAADEPPPPLRSQPGAWPEPLPMPPGPGAPEDEPATASDLFTFRPSRSPYFEDAPARDWAPPDHADTTAEDKPANAALDLPEVNVEIIQDLIKKLADELNGAVAAQPGPGPELPFPPEARAESMLDRSIEALETTAHNMRSAGPPPLDRGERHAEPWPRPPRSQPQPSGPPMVDPQLARIADAIAAERIEVLLEPIQGLTEGRARHYEVSIRLRAADGATLEQKEVARLAEGSGLMPRIDAMRMARAVRVAQRLGDRGRSGALLTATAGESLTDAEFLDAVAVQPGTDGRISLVLSFSQSDVRAFTPAHAEALGSMAAAGFGFALEDVTDLDMDFGRLKAMGFEFIKLDAEVFLDGLQAPSGRVPAADICRFLSEFGLTLIVGRIEDDWLLARILGFGVLLGKGTLFGGAKLVKPEVVADRGIAAA